MILPLFLVYRKTQAVNITSCELSKHVSCSLCFHCSLFLHTLPLHFRISHEGPHSRFLPSPLLSAVHLSLPPPPLLLITHSPVLVPTSQRLRPSVLPWCCSREGALLFFLTLLLYLILFIIYLSQFLNALILYALNFS